MNCRSCLCRQIKNKPILHPYYMMEIGPAVVQSVLYNIQLEFYTLFDFLCSYWLTISNINVDLTEF